MSPPSTWRVERSRGRAGAFHGRALPDPAVRTVWVLEVDRPALVLGSTQPWSVADEEATAVRGVELVRRRSGGGAVLLEPGGAVWVDVVLPRDDPLWRDDVGAAAHWLGATWVAALGDLGVGGGEVHRGGLCATPWSRLVCFGGLGPGEVAVTGRKAVGISQRRTRAAARFQTAAHLRWDPAELVALLDLSPPERRAAATALADAVLPLDAPGDDVVGAVLAHLPR